jgi:hypothetical protein
MLFFDTYFMAKENRTTHEIPVEGSIGLLAVGYEGLVAWRKVRLAKGQRIVKSNSVDQKTNKK